MTPNQDRLPSTAKRRELGIELRRIRKRAGYTGGELGLQLNWNASTISRLEKGLSKVEDGRVALYLARAGATPAELDDLVTLDRRPDDGYQVRPHPAGCPDSLSIITMLDTESTSITTYDPVEVPRHLQVETYIRNSRGYDHCHDLDTILRTRLHSQQSSFRHPRSFTFYIPETVLGEQIGCPTVAHAQLSHLLTASSLPHCRIHLVPTGAGLADIRTAFTLYQHDDHRPVIQCQLPSISLFLENDHDIAFFESYLERITRPALSRQETRDWLTGRLAKLEATPG